MRFLDNLLIQNYKQKEDLKKAVIDIIRERDENADVDAITAVFEKKYPSMRGQYCLFTVFDMFDYDNYFLLFYFLLSLLHSIQFHFKQIVTNSSSN